MKGTRNGRPLDPTHTDPDKYKLVFENDQVRVLKYRDTPGVKTEPHRHPNSVLLFLSDFQRRLTVGNDIFVEPLRLTDTAIPASGVP